MSEYCFGCSDLAFLDFNFDGTNDFAIGLYYDYGLSGYLPTRSACMLALGSNKIAYTVSSRSIFDYDFGDYIIITDSVAEKLNFSDTIDVDYSFASLSAIIRNRIEGYDETESYSFGKWGNNDTSYAAVQFMIDGLAHYGWIQLHHHLTFDVSLAALDFAYNTIPGEPLIAGAIPVVCSAPAFAYEIITPTAVKLFFTPEDISLQYTIRYRIAGAPGAWTTQNKFVPNFKLTGLDCDATYEYQVRSICEADGIIFSSPWSGLQFITSGSCRVAGKEEGLSVFPVPAQHRVTLQANSDMVSVQMMHIDGRQVMVLQPNNRNVEINLDNIAPGMYMLIVTTEEGMETRMLTVE